MYSQILLCLFMCMFVLSYPQYYVTQNYKVGIEYDGSLPMSGGSDRLRHRNNYDPFFVTVTAKAKDGYVISYLEISATTSSSGHVTFSVLRGGTGSKSMSFHLASNNSDFLKYNYLAYGIRDEEYKKVMSASYPLY